MDSKVFLSIITITPDTLIKHPEASGGFIE